MTKHIEIAGIQINLLNASKAISDALYWAAYLETVKGEGIAAEERETLLLLQSAMLEHCTNAQDATGDAAPAANQTSWNDQPGFRVGDRHEV